MLGTTISTFCGQNLGAGKYERIRKGILTSILMGWVWCVLCVITSYTVVPAFVKMLIGGRTTESNRYSNTIFKSGFAALFCDSDDNYHKKLTAGNRRQACYYHIKVGFELAGKVVITFTLVQFMGYWGVIVSELVWVHSGYSLLCS